MPEFFVTAKYQMKLPDGVDGVDGGVIMPSGVASHVLTRRRLDKGYPHLTRRLLDPQYYLAELNPATCRRACTNLSSYDWFNVKKQTSYDSGKASQASWAESTGRIIDQIWVPAVHTRASDIDGAISRCIEFQDSLGTEAVILPAPLTRDPYSDYSTELDWLERGLRLSRKLAPLRPAYATVAISDITLRQDPPQSNSLISTILDQLSARGVQGVYLVPVMASEDSYYFTNSNAVGGILRLCNGLKAGGVRRVVVAFAGTLGIPCLSLGADVWTSGWHRSERRMRLSDFEIAGGRVVPAYYTHHLGGEVHVERDLDSMVRMRHLDRISDPTPASTGLLRALAAGRKVASVPEWRYRIGNKTASIEQFLHVAVRETRRLDGVPKDEARIAVQRWLRAIHELSTEVQDAGPFNPRTAVSHQYGWQIAYANALRNAY